MERPLWFRRLILLSSAVLALSPLISTAGELPTPLVPVGVPPAVVFRTEDTGDLATLGAAVAHTLALDAEQVLSVVAVPDDPALQLEVTIASGAGDLATATAGVAGETVVLQGAAAATADTYTITVENAAGTGGYALTVWLNAVTEETGDNGSLAKAQDLNASAIPLAQLPRV